jgi:polyisoprenoid-binding protein YceI
MVLLLPWRQPLRATAALWQRRWTPSFRRREERRGTMTNTLEKPPTASRRGVQARDLRPGGVDGTHPTRPRRWALDSSRSTVEFRVPTFWGLSTVVGHFDRFDGFYGLDSEDVLAIELAVDADSLDTGNSTRDRHLRSERFFDVRAHPQVRFTSTLVSELDETLALVGHLEAAGRTAPVALDATLRETGDELEIEATTTFDQRELGMTFSPLGMIRTPSTLHVRARLTPDRGPVSAD